jgi:hypothetical protein
VTGIYLYGIVAAAEPTDSDAAGNGSRETGVRRIVHGDLAALVTDVDGAQLTAARELRAHWHVLEQASAHATVLPIQFGTVMESDDAVVERFLRPRHDQLVARLAALAGRVQVTVKCFYEEDQLLRGVVKTSPDVARLRESVRGRPEAATYYQRIQLGELVAGHVEHARERDASVVIGRLEPLAVAARRETISTRDGAVSAAFLVDRDRVEEFSAAVAELEAEVKGRMRVRYIGPLPPYSFTEEESAAWA